MTAPLLRPVPLAIAIGGQPIERSLARCLSLALVRQALAAPSVAELDFADPEPGTTSALRPGETLLLSQPDGRTLFEGEIARTEHDYNGANGHVLRIRAYDRLQRLRTRRRTRALPNTSAAKLAASLAAEIDCAAGSAPDSPERVLVIQEGESDLELLVDLAGEAGLHPFLDEGTLRLVRLDGEGEAIALALGRSLHTVRVTFTNEGALAKAEARGWAPATSDRFRGEAPLASQDAVEFRDVGPIPDGAGRLILNVLADGEDEARALAQADMDRGSARDASIAGTAPGDPALRPGRIVRLEGVAPEASGRYVLTETLHRFDATGGYLTEFGTRPPAPPRRRRHPRFSLGEVIDTADPEGFGRCRVKLPAFSDVESGWVPVVVPGAGRSKGLGALPETGDDVLVLFPDGDPARGIVLGGLYGRKRLPAGLGRKKARPFVLRTGGGQTLELSGEGSLARLSTSGGSLVELAPGRMRVAAASDLVLEAPGRTITIRAAAINFERG